MLKRSNIIYFYDGSFDGFLCCIFECFNNHEYPLTIVDYDKYEFSLYESRAIQTNSPIAKRVSTGIKKNISPAAFNLVLESFYTNLENKEILILEFLEKGFKIGNKIIYMHSDEQVNKLEKAVLSLKREVDHYRGFIRFSIYKNSMVSIIEPKNFVLPFLVSHFCDRFPNEDFLIYDKVHQAAIIYNGHKADIVSVDNITLPETTKEEQTYRDLWKLFYNTIAIEERENLKCQLTHLPKRFRTQLTEFK